jgi:hypothetical protein
MDLKKFKRTFRKDIQTNWYVENWTYGRFTIVVTNLPSTPSYAFLDKVWSVYRGKTLLLGTFSTNGMTSGKELEQKLRECLERKEPIAKVKRSQKSCCTFKKCMYN